MSIKTFDLEPVLTGVGPVKASSNSPNGQISPDNQIASVAFASGQLFVGSVTGWIYRFGLHQVVSGHGRSSYKYKPGPSKYCGQKKPVIQLNVIHSLNRVLYLCDGVLAMLDAATVEIVQTNGSRIKGAMRFSVSDRIDPENPFASYEVCVAKKKALLIYSIHEISFTQLIEIQISDPIIDLVYSDPFICFASHVQYHVVHAKEESPQISDLFPFPDRPVILSLTDSDLHEFLLSGPGGLGMFVSAQTLVAPRPPINWAELKVVKMHYSSPYILVYGDTDVWVYSSINQQPKQSLVFDGCRSVCHAEFAGKNHSTPLMASATQIWAMDTVPWQEQVETLLEDKRVSEALQIVQSFILETDTLYYQNVLHRATLIQLHRNELAEAMRFLLESQAPPEDILQFCPDLIQGTGMEEVVKGSKAGFTIDLFESNLAKVVQKRNEFLLDYLERLRRTSTEDFSQDLNLVELRLLAALERKALLPFVKSYRNVLSLEPTKTVLDQWRRYVALAYFLLRSGEVSEALLLMQRIADEEVMNTVDDPVELNTIADIARNHAERRSQQWTASERTVIVDSACCLSLSLPSNDLRRLTEIHVLPASHCELNDLPTVLRTLEWLLKRDEGAALRLATSVSSDVYSDILPLLDSYPKVRFRYLENLIREEIIVNEEIHGMMADQYLNMLKKMPDVVSSDAMEIRQSLQKLLQSDVLRNGDGLMKAVVELRLDQERVILLAKAGKHWEALEFLVKEMKNNQGAVEYCLTNAKGDPVRKREMFEYLLGLHFNSREQNEESVRSALELLNDENADLDAVKVLSMLPANWPVESLQPFFKLNLRRLLHNQRMDRIERNLAHQIYLLAGLASVGCSRTKIVITDDRRCVVCRKVFLDSTFRRLASGQIAHLDCHLP